MIPRVLLFDLDGTLTDSRLGIMRCMRYALERLDAPCPADALLESHIGSSLRTTFRSLLATLDPGRVQRAVGLYHERYADTGLYENQVYPGIPEMLDALAAEARLFVATQKFAPYADVIVGHFGLRRYFGGIYGTDFGGRLDDKGQVIASLLRTERVRAADAVMIGDRAHDVLAARDNGMSSIGVLWGYGSPTELASAGAGGLCEAPAGLTACLRQLGRR